MSSDSGVKVRFVSDIAIVELTGKEKRLNLQYLKDLNEAYDAVLRNPNAKAVVTISTGKFFSNGIDLAWLAQQSPDTHGTFMLKFCTFVARILTFPLPTIAALNGHAFAGGAFFSLAHDYRIMKTGRGWWCINEVHLRLMIPIFLLDLIRTKIPNGKTITDVVAFGKRFTAEEALKACIVQRVCGEAELEDAAVKLANEITAGGAFDRDALQNMKMDVYEAAYSNREKSLPYDWSQHSKL